MTVLKVGEYGVPEGPYLAKFVGVVERAADPKRIGQDGRPYPPGLEWNFEVANGEFKGKTVSTITSQQPTAKNSCGRMISQMSGGAVALRKGAEFDPATYVGQFFNLIVGTNSTGNGTRVDTVMPAHALPSSAAPALASATPATNGPPPRPQAPAASAHDPELWVAFGTADPVKMTQHALQTKVDAESLDPRDISLCADGQNWVTAVAYGIKTKVPF